MEARTLSIDQSPFVVLLPHVSPALSKETVEKRRGAFACPHIQRARTRIQSQPNVGGTHPPPPPKLFCPGLQSQPKVVGTFELDHVSPIPPNQCWKILRLFQQKGTNHPIINIVSGGRENLLGVQTSLSGIVDHKKRELRRG